MPCCEYSWYTPPRGDMATQPTTFHMCNVYNSAIWRSFTILIMLIDSHRASSIPTPLYGVWKREAFRRDMASIEGLSSCMLLYAVCWAGVDETPEERIDKANNAREIAHKNTRFTASPFNTDKNQQSLSGAVSSQGRVIPGQIGPDGKEILPAQSPRVGGYGFVATPSPAPGQTFTASFSVWSWLTSSWLSQKLSMCCHRTNVLRTLIYIPIMHCDHIRYAALTAFSVVVWLIANLAT